tara:strand:+ start:508 stop:642 length:135 start_codon:yes stop_codon:yes gene_type:complete
MTCPLEARHFDRCACQPPHLTGNLLAHGGHSVLEKSEIEGEKEK